MDTEVFIANVKEKCKALNTTPTAACIKSGAGKNLISNMKNGEKASYKRIELLASYLGCSISDLTGEKIEPTVQDDGLTEEEQWLINMFRRLTPEQKEFVLGAVQAAADKQ